MYGELAVTVGVFDEALHAEYKALPPGLRKSRIGSRLVLENEPLIKTLVAQITGRAEPTTRRKSLAARIGGRGGFEDIEPEDAMQLGRVAFLHALDGFDPRKGRLAGYVVLWLRHEMQRSVTFELHLARAPAGKSEQRPRVGLVGLPSENEERASSDERGYFGSTNRHEDMLESTTPPGGEKLGKVAAGVDWEDALAHLRPEDVARWDETGEWPESLEAWAGPSKPTIVYSIPRPHWEVFAACELTFAPAARVLRSAVGDAFERWCGDRGVTPDSRAYLYDRLGERGARETRVWIGSPRRGLSGVRATMKTAAPKRARTRAPLVLTDYEKHLRLTREWMARSPRVPVIGVGATTLTG